MYASARSPRHSRHLRKPGPVEGRSSRRRPREGCGPRRPRSRRSVARSVRVALLAATVLVVPGCGDGREPPAPPPGFTHAAATRDCGPADGPAVSIYLASQPVDRVDPPAPFIHLYLWRGLDDLAGERWS